MHNFVVVTDIFSLSCIDTSERVFTMYGIGE